MHCPDDDRLISVLAGVTEDMEVEKHIETCPDCIQRRLQLLKAYRTALAYEEFSKEPAARVDEPEAVLFAERSTDKGDGSSNAQSDGSTTSQKRPYSERKRRWLGLALSSVAMTIIAVMGWQIFIADTGPETRIDLSQQFIPRYRQTSGSDDSRTIPQAPSGEFRVRDDFEVVLGDVDTGFASIVLITESKATIEQSDVDIASLQRDSNQDRTSGVLREPSEAVSILVLVTDRPAIETLSAVVASSDWRSGDAYLDALREAGFLTVLYRILEVMPEVVDASSPSVSDNSLTSQQTEVLAARGHSEVVTHAQQLHSAGRYREALDATQQALSIQVSVLGELHPYSSNTHKMLARLHDALDEFEGARIAWSSVKSIETPGVEPWRVREAKFAIRDLDRILSLSPGEVADLKEARRILAARRPGSLRDLPAYVEAGRTALDRIRQLLGDQSRSYAEGLVTLASRHMYVVDFAQAVQLNKQALSVFRSHIERGTRFINIT